MPSSPQTVTTRGVFDYLVDSAGKAMANKTVNVTLNFNGASVTSPIVNVGELQQSTVTDQNGFWRFLLIPNDTLTPTGTLYTILTPASTYDISVPSGGADVQSSSILANVPSVLSPALTNLTGPITVTGNESVTGTLSVTGTTTLGSTTAGATTLGATSVGGDLTIASAFRLLFGAVAAKIIPGATSISLRDNADANDNLIITNAGNVTIRGSETITGGGWTLTAGNATITAGDAVIAAGRLLLNAAVAKIKGGATSLSLRNNADSADNVLVTDAGLVTLRNAISIPPVAAGTLAPTSYGSVPVKLAEATPSGGTSFTLPASGSIPAGYRNLELTLSLRSTVAAVNALVNMTMNGDTGTNYDHESAFISGTTGTWASGQSIGVTSIFLGWAAAASGPANAFGIQRVTIHDYLSTVKDKHLRSTGHIAQGYSAGAFYIVETAGSWHPASPVAVTSLTITLGAGNFVASGCLATLWGYP